MPLCVCVLYKCMCVRSWCIEGSLATSVDLLGGFHQYLATSAESLCLTECQQDNQFIDWRIREIDFHCVLKAFRFNYERCANENIGRIWYWTEPAWQYWGCQKIFYIDTLAKWKEHTIFHVTAWLGNCWSCIHGQ